MKAQITFILTAMSFCVPARAQVAAQNGRALDANNRVGTGGYNDRVGAGAGMATQNNIIYGNVTGGRQFRGPLLERDPGAFMGPTAGGLTDRFIASSSGAPQPYQPSFDLSTPQPFFGMSRAAPPPVGSVRVGFTGGYLGTSLTPQGAMGNEFAAYDWQNQQLGESMILGTHATLSGTHPGETIFEGGRVENQPSALSASPLYGIQPMQNTMTTNTEIGAIPEGPAVMAPGGPADRFRVNQAEVQRMRSELQGAAQQNGEQQQNQQENNQQPGAQGLNQPLESPENRALSGQFSNTLRNPAFASNTMGGRAQRPMVVSPELQSTQYSELRRRLARYQNAQIAAMEEQHQEQIARQAVAARGAGATSRPSVLPNMPSSSTLRQPGMAMLNLPPVKITSLATGIRARGLHDLMSGAEDLMRQGKFQSALDRYGLAQQVAPNNPLILLGRANAELGSGAYRQAGSDLHAVFASDQATLMAQYDLNAWFQALRMSAIRQELSDLSAKDANDEMPEFLLAYISYNTGDPQAAAQHLAEARKRARGNDPVLPLLETDWKLEEAKPASPPSTELNK